MRLLLLFLPVLLMAVCACAQVAYCPRVTSEHNADTTDLGRFRQYHKWKDKTGGDLAVAIWQYLSDYETGLYHFNEVHDGPDPFGEFSTMREPLKMLNVYNMGYCGIFGPTTAGIMHGVGFDTVRSFGVNAWSHCATELYYGEGWHYFDVDVRGALMKADGTIASLDEATKNKQLWVESLDRIKPNFPHHNTPEKAARVADIYANTTLDFYYRWFQGSHTADWFLRPGETFTRWWQPQGGRWNHLPMYNRIDWVRKLLETKPRGMKPNHRHFTKWNHGNGLFQYAPDLTSDSRDVAAGAYCIDGLQPGKEGLELTGEEGTVVFEVFTPFLIVAKINDLDDFDDDAEASVVSLDAAVPVTVEVSTDNGLTWKTVTTLEPGKQTLDLTRQVKQTWGYLLRLRAEGEAGQTAIRSLGIDTWVQVAPISLPRLKKGSNKLCYDADDRYGKSTQPMLVLPNVADPADLEKYVVSMPETYDPQKFTRRIVGEVIIKLQAPKGQKIDWLSAGGTFSTERRDLAKNTKCTIGYATGDPKDFQQVWESDVPDWTDHWRFNYDTDIRLDSPAETVYLRYVGDPAVNVIRTCLHLTPAVEHDPAMVITHGYRMDGELAETTVELEGPGEYTVDCADEVENVFIRMAKPSTASAE